MKLPSPVLLAMLVAAPGWAEDNLPLPAPLGTVVVEAPADAQPDPNVIAAIRSVGGNVMEIAQNDPRLDVTLHLADKEVTDDILAEVAKLKNVVWLNLAGTKITDDGLKHIANMTTLEKLHLEKTGIGDAGLAHLKNLKKLSYLNLYGTKVSDFGLVHLYPLKQLKRVYVWQSQVSDDGVKALRAVLPEAEVVGALELKPVEPAKEEPKQEAKKEN